MIDDLTPAAGQLLRATLLDSDLGAQRIQFCHAVTTELREVSSWLGFDSWLGGGEPVALRPQVPTATDADGMTSRRAFRGVAAVVEMASELGSGSVALLDADLRYAAAALIRQLIEAEYLIASFAEDISRAAVWHAATPEQIRQDFRPKTMRTRGGFSHSEYRSHCDNGGHPAPSGIFLLQHGIHHSPDLDGLYLASLWGDLAQHLRRVWTATVGLLSEHHPRFVVVRATNLGAVSLIEERWVDMDPLARSVDAVMLNELSEPKRP